MIAREGEHPAEVDPRELAGRIGAVRQEISRQKLLMCPGHQVVGVAPADHVPTEVAAHRRLADGRRRIEQAIDAVLGVGHVVPERIVDVLGAVEVDHVVRARCR